MNCPICRAPFTEKDQECACGEVLTSWAKFRRNGQALRQRGLTLAAQGDNVGALVAFLEAALSDPMDGVSLVDAARALYHLGRPGDALRLLENAGPRAGPGASAVIEAIRSLAASKA